MTRLASSMVGASQSVLLRSATRASLVARLKSQAHWQTDVIAGGLLGTGFWNM